MTKNIMEPVFKFAIREDLSDTENLFLPKKAEPNATGYDVRAAFPKRESITVKPYQYFKIPLGFRCIPQEGWWFFLFPRSSMFFKKQTNALYGVIDQDFSLECCFLGSYQPDLSQLSGASDIVINFGDAIGQIIPQPRHDMIPEKIDNSTFDKIVKDKKAVRTGGLGSTGI